MALDVENTFKLLHFYELVEGRPPFHLDKFQERCQAFESVLQSDRQLLFGIVSFFDCILAVVLFNEGFVYCEQDPLRPWLLILTLLNFLACYLPLLISAVNVKHALFLSHPITFLAYTCFKSMQHFRDGVFSVVARAYKEKLSRMENTLENSMCRIVAGFFNSHRLAIMIGLLLKFHTHQTPSTVMSLECLIVVFNYVRMFYSQLQFCMENRYLDQPVVVAFLASWALHGNLMIYVLPIVDCVLIWDNMQGTMKTRICYSSKAEE